MSDIKDKVDLITGASSGIGEASRQIAVVTGGNGSDRAVPTCSCH